MASQMGTSSLVLSKRLISWMPVGEVTLISVKYSPMTSMPTKIRPRSLEEFAAITGVGKAKLTRYGEDFLLIIASYAPG